MKASSFPPLPSPSLSFPGESLDLFGRTTKASLASLPPGGVISEARLAVVVCWWWSLALSGESLLLPLPWLASSNSSRLHWSCSGGCFPPYSGGCLATAVVLVLVSGGCFAALVGRVDALPTLSCCRSLHPWRCNILLQVPVAVVSRFAGLPMSSPFFLAVFVFALIASAY